MYKYTGSGLDGIFLKNGYTIVETSYGQGVKIEDIDGLHRAIAVDIIRQTTPMNGRQFRFLRKEQDLIQEEVAAIFRVDVQTIANWEKRGAQEIPGPADVAMRAFYAATFMQTLARLCLNRTPSPMRARHLRWMDLNGKSLSS